MGNWDKLDRFEDHHNRLHNRIPDGTRRGSTVAERIRHETGPTPPVEKNRVGGATRPFLHTLLGVALLSLVPGFADNFSKRHEVVYEQPGILDASTYPQPARMPETPKP